MSLFWPDPQKDLQALIELHEELVQLRREAERLTNAPGVKVYRVRDYGAIREAGRARSMYRPIRSIRSRRSGRPAPAVTAGACWGLAASVSHRCRRAVLESRWVADLVYEVSYELQEGVEGRQTMEEPMKKILLSDSQRELLYDVFYEYGTEVHYEGL